MSQMIEVPKPIYDALVGVFNAVDAVMTEDERPVDARIEDAAGAYMSELRKWAQAQFAERLAQTPVKQGVDPSSTPPAPQTEGGGDG